jgi:hypothetical protein
MPSVLYISKNLIGDGLNIAPAWRAWWAQHQESGYEVDLLTNPDQIAPLYSVMGVPANLITDTSVEEATRRKRYDFVFDFDVSTAFQLGHSHRLHICEAYARMLGVEISSVKPVCLLDSVSYGGHDIAKGCILVSPFSASCSSRRGKPPNKMLPVSAWAWIIRSLETFDRKIYVLGSQTDKEVPEFSLPKDCYLLGSHKLLEIARIMRDRAAMIVTVDNGMAHLAASQELPTFLFYPACLSMHWILPRGNPHCVPMQLDPASCDVSRVVKTVKTVVPDLLKIRMQSESV